MWQTTENPIKVRIVDNSILKIDKVVRSINMIIGGSKFFVPTIYQRESGVDIIIGNNFLNLYSPFTQYLYYIIISTLEKEQVYVPKIKQAKSVASKEFLIMHQKQKRGEVIQSHHQPHVEDLTKTKEIDLWDMI